MWESQRALSRGSLRWASGDRLHKYTIDLFILLDEFHPTYFFGVMLTVKLL